MLLVFDREKKYLCAALCKIPYNSHLDLKTLVVCKSEVTLKRSAEARMQPPAGLIQLEQLGCCCPETLQVKGRAILAQVRHLWVHFSFLFENSVYS